MACLRLGLLGPLEIWRHGQPIKVTAAKQRSVLALLALRTSETVPAEQLISAIWDTTPPATARRTLHSLISRLRTTLACRDAPLIDHQEWGYRLLVPPEQVDVHVFEGLVGSAGHALSRERASAAAAILRRALDLWRGRALADIPRSTLAEAEAVRLEEQYYLALDQRMDADLRLGRHAQLLGELQAATTTWPLRERFWHHLMLALYRTGRQADALNAYHRARARITSELGVEPSHALRRLHHRLLTADPTLIADPALIADPTLTPAVTPRSAHLSTVPWQQRSTPPLRHPAE